MSTSNINPGCAVVELKGTDHESYLVTRSGLRLNRIHLFKERPFFPFEKLPAEIKNKIYRMVLVTGFLNIPITDMDYNEFHERDKSTALRTPYWTVTHDDEEASPPTNPNGTWTSKNITTYCAPSDDDFKDSHVARDTFALLSLNHQTRNEALPIFYGENRFVFCSEGCIVPFLQDRTPLARTSIRHIRLLFLLEDDGNNAARQRTWAKNFNYISANIPHLASLELHILDSEGRMLIRNTDFARPPVIGGKWMKWVRPLMSITNLQKFVLEIELGSFGTYSRSSSSGTYQQEANAMNKWLSFLEPRMLAPGVQRGFWVPPGNRDIGVGAPPRAYVWETEDEDEDTEEEGEDDEGEEVGEVDNSIDMGRLVHEYGAGGMEGMFDFSMNNAEVFEEDSPSNGEGAF